MSRYLSTDPINFSSPCDLCGEPFTQRMQKRPLRFECGPCCATRTYLLARTRRRTA
jgi:hypothetical protein